MAARATSSCGRIAAQPARRRFLARKKAFAGTRKPSKKAVDSKLGMPATSTSRRRADLIRRKIQALRTLLPRADGEQLQQDRPRLDELLLHSAGYILHLQMQVEVMQFMVDVLNPKD